MMKLSVLTWNIWDVPYFVSRDRRERVGRLMDHLILYRPHIALLQEAFRFRSRKRIADRLNGNGEPLYNMPENIYGERRLLGFIPFFDATGGLVTLSRYPIQESEFQPFEAVGPTLDERICRKGYTLTYVCTPEGRMLVVNTHLSNRPQDIEIRKKQLEQLFDAIQYVEDTVILGGDFNTTKTNGGDQLTEEFEMIEEAGFTDSLVGDEKNFITFSRENPYNMFDEHGRYDYVFYRPKAEGRMIPTRSALIAPRKPVSDHHGYAVEFEINGRRTAEI